MKLSLNWTDLVLFVCNLVSYLVGRKHGSKDGE